MKPALLLLSTLTCLHLAAATNSAQSNTNCAPAQEQLKAAELAAQDDPATAANRYEEAVRIAPACVEALVNLGAVYNRLNRPDDAIAAFQRALKENPQLFAAHLNLGITYFRARRFDLARDSLRAALKLDPQNTQARQLLALSLFAPEQFADAATELEELVKEVMDVTGAPTPVLFEDDAPVLADDALRESHEQGFYLVGLIVVVMAILSFVGLR